MATRIVMIHKGLSSECPCPACHAHGGDYSDATFTFDERESQGRPVEWREDGTPRGGAIGGLMFTLAFWLVVGVLLVAVGSR